ncbi:MAG: N-6 DNA methylase, partial [Planctomycetota bacterium]|nr:N-6 DNA methylase [Planctomycetota bacterium]
MSKRHRNRTGDLESMFLRLEELVLAGSGEDEFEVVFQLLVAKLWDERRAGASRFRAGQIEALLREAEAAWPGIVGDDAAIRLAPEHLAVCVDALGKHTVAGADLQVLDAFFEFLVSRGAKGVKGQYFTPRPVVELCVRMLRPSKDESVLDPACGSGGFLLHALERVRREEGLEGASLSSYAAEKLWGFDIDARAVRVARALMLVAADGRANLACRNSLSDPDVAAAGPFDVILTNPPFAGEIRGRRLLDGYALGRGKPRVERDVLFLERCVGLLKPGGRMAIVLPHNKLAGGAFESVRRWLMGETRVLAVVGLGRNTFLPHTHQKASVLFARKRLPGEVPAGDEPIFFAVSERDGKDSKGRPRLRPGAGAGTPAWEAVDHDLAGIVDAVHGDPREHARCIVKQARDLDPPLVLAPERYDPRRTALRADAAGATLGEIAGSLRRTMSPATDGDARCMVLDTSDARDGFVLGRKEPVARAKIGSAKKLVEPGCVLISRLRPYLRQVALADGSIPGWQEGVSVVCSTE